MFGFFALFQNRIISFLLSLFLVGGLSIFIPINTSAQTDESCYDYSNNRAEKVYEKAIKSYRQRTYTECIGLLNDVIAIEPEYVDAYFVLGLIYIKENRMNLKAASENFNRVIELCPDYDVYAYYQLSRIAYGAREYQEAYDNINKFLEDVDLIKSDADYEEAVRLLDFSKFYIDILNNPVPFDPHPVPGISTEYDEYLPIISPDNGMALFTRKMQSPPTRDDITPQMTFKERFMFSFRENEEFERGNLMPPPFNKNNNEGGATIAINNKLLYYTLCKFASGGRYYNCDICFSENINGTWTPIESISDKVNLENTWESQPSITSDGKTLFFVSDRDGGFGGYDIYKTVKDENGEWCSPENLGSKINSIGNEKSPFIHTDSQTLYFSSDGLMGLGGYDIFLAKLNEDGSWNDPKNIGYPINSYDDDLGFFVSTDGEKGYFASNKFEGFGGWDLYSFNLYEEARPEKVLFIKGIVSAFEISDFKNTHIELKNVESKKITEIEVDSITGEYYGAVVFRDDYIMTVKKKGYVHESNYMSAINPRFSKPLDIFIDLKPIEVGMSYRLNDIYFDFNSVQLKPESIMVMDEFYLFLNENPTLKISIEGHTDNIGSDVDNQVLSENRSKSVYDYLVKRGIQFNRMSYKGFGESVPIESNETEDGRARNRRTEFVIIEK